MNLSTLNSSLSGPKNRGHLSFHGLIFGSRSILGLEKFLRECWKLDTVNGEANFSLDGDIPETGGKLALPGLVKGSKLRRFKEFLENEILLGNLKTNKEIYYLTLQKACLPKHAREVITEMKNKGKIAKTLSVSYDSVVKKNKTEMIQLIT